MSEHFKVQVPAMSCTQLVAISILTVTVLPVAIAQWGIQPVQENQNVFAPPTAPSPFTPPSVPNSHNDRFSDIVRRLQFGAAPSPVISYRPGYQQYDPAQNNPTYYPSPSYPNQVYAPNQGNTVPGYPSQGYDSGQGNPGFNPIPGYSNQGYPPSPSYPVYNPSTVANLPFYNPSPIPASAYAGGYPDQRQNPMPNPNPAYQQAPQYNPVYNPIQPQPAPSIYPDFSSNIAPAPTNPAIIDPSRPYMRPEPQDDESVNDRSRDTQSNVWNQWAAEHLGGSSFWDKTASGSNQPTRPTTPAPTTMSPSTRPSPRVDPSFFNPDGTVNTNRLGMMAVPVEEDAVRDRQAGYSAYNLFMSLL
ncbi:hypothetical protein EGW08_010639, partial [Elysia chlorotica]